MARALGLLVTVVTSADPFPVSSLKYEMTLAGSRAYHLHMASSRSVRIVDCERGVAARLATRLVDKLAVRRTLDVARLSQTPMLAEQVDARYYFELQNASLIVFIVSDQWEPAALDSVIDLLAPPLAVEVPIMLVYVDHVDVGGYVEHFGERWQLQRGSDGELVQANLYSHDFTNDVEDDVPERALSKAAHALAKAVRERLEPSTKQRANQAWVLAVFVTCTLVLVLSFTWPRTPDATTELPSPAKGLTVLSDADGLTLCDALAEIDDLDPRCLYLPYGMLEHPGVALAWADSAPVVLVRGDEVEIIVDREFWRRLPVGDPERDPRLGPFRSVKGQSFIVLVEMVVDISSGHKPRFGPAEQKQLLDDSELFALGFVLAYAAGSAPRSEALGTTREAFVERCAKHPATPSHRRWLCPAIEKVVSVPTPGGGEKATSDRMLSDCRAELDDTVDLDRWVAALLLDADPNPSCLQMLRWQQTLACLYAKTIVLDLEPNEGLEARVEAIRGIAGGIASRLPSTSACPDHLPDFASAFGLELAHQLQFANALPDDQRVALLAQAVDWMCLGALSWSSLNGGLQHAGLVYNWAELWLASGSVATEPGPTDSCSRDTLLAALDTLAPGPRDGEKTDPAMLYVALLAWMIDPSNERARRLLHVHVRLSVPGSHALFDPNDNPWVAGKLGARCCEMSQPCVCDLLEGAQTPERAEKLNEILQGWGQSAQSATSK